MHLGQHLVPGGLIGIRADGRAQFTAAGVEAVGRRTVRRTWKSTRTEYAARIEELEQQVAALTAELAEKEAELATSPTVTGLDYLRLLRASGVKCGWDGCTNVGMMGLEHCFKHLDHDERTTAQGAMKVLQIKRREVVAA